MVKKKKQVSIQLVSALNGLVVPQSFYIPIDSVNSKSVSMLIVQAIFAKPFHFDGVQIHCFLGNGKILFGHTSAELTDLQLAISQYQRA